MLINKNLDILINEHYDNELNISRLINFESRLATSQILNDYTIDKQNKMYLISQSITRVKNRIKNTIRYFN